MKPSFIRLFSLLMLAALPMVATAQNNIKAAFDAIIKCPEAQITENHTLEKDPESKSKIGQSDIYSFVLPANKIKLIRNVISAFDKDSDMAYSLNRGKARSSDRQISLAIGDASGSGVYINEVGHDYVYGLFLAATSEDPEGKFRYAYGISYMEYDGSIVGKLIVTYATTLKYRQEAEQQRQYDVLRSFSSGTYTFSDNNSSQQSWFDILMSYFQSMTQANTQTRISLASKAFKVIRDTSKYPEVSSADKEAVREILKGMIADKKYSESVLNKLLTQCLRELK